MLSFIKEAGVAVGVAGFFGLSGIAVDLAVGGDWHAFQKSGSLVVCVGIYFGAKDFSGLLADRIEDQVRELEKERSEFDIVNSDKAIAEKAPGTVDNVIDRLKADTERAQKRLTVIDAGILIIGTLIWGFGDLIF